MNQSFGVHYSEHRVVNLSILEMQQQQSVTPEK